MGRKNLLLQQQLWLSGWHGSRQSAQILYCGARLELFFLLKLENRFLSQAREPNPPPNNHNLLFVSYNDRHQQRCPAAQTPARRCRTSGQWSKRTQQRPHASRQRRQHQQWQHFDQASATGPVAPDSANVGRLGIQVGAPAAQCARTERRAACAGPRSSRCSKSRARSSSAPTPASCATTFCRAIGKRCGAR